MDVIFHPWIVRLVDVFCPSSRVQLEQAVWPSLRLSEEAYLDVPRRHGPDDVFRRSQRLEEVE